MNEQLQEIKSVFEQWCKGKGGELAKEDIEWLIDQAEKIERYEKALKQIVDMEYGDLDWFVITTIYEDIAEEALKA